jgi:hypothetical protein
MDYTTLGAFRPGTSGLGSVMPPLVESRNILTGWAAVDN